MDNPHDRSALVELVRATLQRDSFPRLAVFTIVLIAGGCAFLFSALTLKAGLHSMALRYGLAAITGYLSFALLVRGWIAMRKGQFDQLDLTLDVLPDLGLADGGSAAADTSRLFAGGRSGGGGSTGNWAAGPGDARAITPLPVGPGSKTTSGGGSGLSGVLDSDDGWKIALAAALVLGAVLAAGFVVYSAPALLAEVAVDAGVMTTVYRRIRRGSGHWTGAVLRRTWLPALVVTVFMTGAGFLLQQIAPDARSIGGVMRIYR